jgi:hypothetical protein
MSVTSRLKTRHGTSVASFLSIANVLRRLPQDVSSHMITNVTNSLKIRSIFQLRSWPLLPLTGHPQFACNSNCIARTLDPQAFLLSFLHSFMTFLPFRVVVCMLPDLASLESPSQCVVCIPMSPQACIVTIPSTTTSLTRKMDIMAQHRKHEMSL